jgi:4-methylaminobutanoate oxidase (formaldehyde-forming)
MLWGGELVLRDGRAAGQVTSVAYGATVGACVGLALLRADGPVRQHDLHAASYDVDLAGERLGIRVSLRAPLA